MGFDNGMAAVFALLALNEPGIVYQLALAFESGLERAKKKKKEEEYIGLYASSFLSSSSSDLMQAHPSRQGKVWSVQAVESAGRWEILYH